jgi:hypothetical protein
MRVLNGVVLVAMIPYVAQPQCISMLHNICTPVIYFCLGNKHLKVLMYICALLLDQLLHAICCELLSVDDVTDFRILQTAVFLNKMSIISQICCPIWLFVAILYPYP